MGISPKTIISKLKPNPSKRKQEQEDNWKYLALHDEMTKLMNKRGYEQAIEEYTGTPANIVYIDINDLKKTNDTMGHDKGNILIKRTAQTIMEQFPDEGYRIGGDEFVIINQKNTKEEAEEKINNIRNFLKYLTETNEYKLVFSVSIGMQQIESGEKITEAIQAAEDKMYKEKKEYKEGGEEKKEEQEEVDNYNELLTAEQQILKQQIVENHEEVYEQSTERIMRILKEKNELIEAILIANNTFDYLFVFTQTETFYEMVQKMDMSIDFSYLYVLYQGGPQYYGNDEYTSEITHLFEDIGEALLNRRIQTVDDLVKIKGINIFKEIYADIR